jgi:hypothetical protein
VKWQFLTISKELLLISKEEKRELQDIVGAKGVKEP